MPSPFDDFLSWLSPDREEAAIKYEALRRKLIRFFVRGGCHIADEQVDLTFDRASKKVAEGKVDRSVDPNAYCFGVARNVLREYKKLPRFEPVDPNLRLFEPQPRWNKQEWECFDECWARMSIPKRDLLTRWHQPKKGREKIEEHKKMAETEGGINALRIRIHRIMNAFRNCVDRCLRRKSRNLM